MVAPVVKTIILEYKKLRWKLEIVNLFKQKRWVSNNFFEILTSLLYDKMAFYGGRQFYVILFTLVDIRLSDAGRWKILGVPVVIGGDNLPSPVGIGLTDLPNIGGGHFGGASGPLAPHPPVYGGQTCVHHTRKYTVTKHLHLCP